MKNIKKFNESWIDSQRKRISEETEKSNRFYKDVVVKITPEIEKTILEFGHIIVGNSDIISKCGYNNGKYYFSFDFRVTNDKISDLIILFNKIEEICIKTSNAFNLPMFNKDEFKFHFRNDGGFMDITIKCCFCE
jgi:hypothetical protein